VSKQSFLRFPGDNLNPDDDVWLSRQDAWKAFWKSRGGSENIAAGGKVSMCGVFIPHSGKGSSTNLPLPELFWMDLIMQNPLDAEINLSNVTLVVNGHLSDPASADDFIEVEVIKEVTIGPQSSISVRVPAIKVYSTNHYPLGSNFTKIESTCQVEHNSCQI
jgi:hypothetical protein